MGFSSPAQNQFFLDGAGESTGTGYRTRAMQRPVNKMTNLHCYHCLEGGGGSGSFFLLVFNQALAVQYLVLNKKLIEYLKYFIPIKLLDKAEFLG